jgi:hypothetical protein
MSDITGIFEVKFITDLKHERQLYAHLKNNELKKTLSFGYSLYGDCRNKPTLTISSLNGHIDDITNFVSDIELDLKINCIPIKRIKIQCSTDNENVPDECDGEHYFEIMFKINVKEKHEWNKIVNLITPFGAHLLCVSDDIKYVELEDENKYEKNGMFMLRNSDSDSGIFSMPSVILRTYTSLNVLEELTQSLLDLLNQNGFTYENTQKVYSVYDSDVFLDHNWMFVDIPKNFITNVNSNMLLS